MTDTFLTKLADGVSSSSSSDRLKVLGRAAAGSYLRKEADDLNAAVLSVVRDERLNRNEVQRVAEAANQATWDELFVRGRDANTEFAPADGMSVLANLNPEPAHQVSPAITDYLRDAPPSENHLPNITLAEAFGVKGEEDYPALNPLKDLEDLQTKTASASEHLQSMADKLMVELHVEGDRCYQLIKQAHITDGHGLLQIAAALGEVVEDPQFAEDLMKTAVSRLEGEGVRLEPEKEMRKLAAQHVVVNTEHPLMHSVGQLEKLAQAYCTAQTAAEYADDGNKQVNRALREQLRGQR